LNAGSSTGQAAVCLWSCRDLTHLNLIAGYDVKRRTLQSDDLVFHFL
jgi:hypothetical protein